jgi:hypothetical protein
MIIKHTNDAPYFDTYKLENHLLVLDKYENEIHFLNESATVLFLLLIEGVSQHSSLLEQYSDITGFRTSEAERHITSTISQWRKQGWLEEQPHKLELQKTINSESPPVSSRAEFLGKDAELPRATPKISLTISLSNRTSCTISFLQTETVRYKDAIPRLHAILSGLKSEQKKKHINLSFLVDDSKIYVSTPEYRLVTKDESYGLSALATAILHHSYGDEELFATIHAAALRKGTYDIIMPGSSGSGKSTLSAYLAAHGWQYLGDDVVAVGSKTHCNNTYVLPFSTSIGIKPGSWALLAPYYPCIPQLPVIPYADRRAKFIPLEAANKEILKKQRNLIVFPRYVPGCKEAEIKRLSNADTLTKIINSGLTLGLLTPESTNIRKLIKFISQTMCYEVSYASLKDAEIALKNLCEYESSANSI